MPREEKRRKISKTSMWALKWLSGPYLKFRALDSSPVAHVLHHKRAFQGSAPWTAHPAVLGNALSGPHARTLSVVLKIRHAEIRGGAGALQRGILQDLQCFVCLLNIELVVTLTEDVAHVFSLLLSIYVLSFNLFSVFCCIFY